MENEIHEECGVFGVYGANQFHVAMTVYYGLYALQHRGQESCGITVCNEGKFSTHKDLGLVSEVFTPTALETLGEGTMAVGHVRYGTTGNSGRENAQPIVVSHLTGNMATVHNGNLTNASELRHELEMNGSIFHTTSDTEIISYVITREKLHTSSVEEAVVRSMDILEGAYSLILMFDDKLIAVRDKNGFRPLCYGRNSFGDYIIASESCALNSVSAEFIRDIRPGEVVVFDKNGVHSITDQCGKADEAMCIFEYIYFARPDSVIDGCSIHHARMNAGRFLAEDYPVDADIVIGVPDSGIDGAIGYSKTSGIPYGIGFIKNKYIGRTFISPGQKSRENSVKIKLNTVKETVCGKKVVMVDDSIVRGTTCARIVNLLREAGAKEIHVRITAPPFLNPCYYGTDIDSREGLIANHRTTEEICRIIGADSLGYLKKEHLPELAGSKGEHSYCTACFTGDYKTRLSDEMKKDMFEG
ncbi:MAG: amidophosphoribosyltransferase [Oscillospiraceae bacterium]